MSREQVVPPTQGSLPRAARESGLELLRIVAMVLIVMQHVLYFGGVTASTDWGKRILLICGAGGKLGDCLFVLISAYFMVNKKFKWTRVLKIILQATFYSVVIYLIFVCCGQVKFTMKSLVYALFPVCFNQWWFVTAFVFLMLLVPALNLILRTVEKRTLGWALLGVVGFTILFPYISKILTNEFWETPYFNELLVLVELYLIGGYLRLYGLKLAKPWVAFLTFAALAVGVGVTYLGHWREMGDKIGTLSNFVAGVGIFLLVKDWKFKSRLVNTLAATTFGIYLIHENEYMRNWQYAFLRNTVFGGVSSPALLFFLLTISVFFACLLLDFVRLQTIHRGTRKCLQWLDRRHQPTPPTTEH